MRTTEMSAEKYALTWDSWALQLMKKQTENAVKKSLFPHRIPKLKLQLFLQTKSWQSAERQLLWYSFGFVFSGSLFRAPILLEKETKYR